MVDVNSTASPIAVQREEGAITITVEKPSPKLALIFKLKGALGKCLDENREVIDDQSLFLLWSDRFYPIDFNDWALVKTTVVLPRHFQAIAPGRLKKVQCAGEKVNYVFETANPEVCYSVFADSAWIRTDREIDGIRMQTFLHPESQKFAEQIFTTSGEILKFYYSWEIPPSHAPHPLRGWR